MFINILIICVEPPVYAFHFYLKTIINLYFVNFIFIFNSCILNIYIAYLSITNCKRKIFIGMYSIIDECLVNILTWVELCVNKC